MNKLPVFAPLVILLALAVPTAHAQGSRKDDIIFGPGGHPIAGATIRVCQPGATGSPCAPLANIYTDATLTVPATNPFPGDGIGNYHFYAPAGRYMVQITGPGITGTITYPDVILPADLSSSGSGNNISAFGLTLGGNLTVSGNATVNGTLTAANFNPGAFNPSSLNVTGNATIGGPRPHIEVTAYGAKGDGATDDTAAISAAINAACAFPISGAQPPRVAFPPGNYIISQTQGASTSPDLPSCQNLHLVGLGNGSVMSFGAPPQAHIQVTPGANPSPAPVFLITANGVTLENLGIDGYNQAVWSQSGNGLTLNNVCLRVVTTGQADNTPLKLTNQTWYWMRGGCLETLTGASTNGNLPVALITAESITATTTDILLYFTDVTMAGGAVHYSQRANDSGGPPGDWVFRNITREASNQDFLLITNDTGNAGNIAMSGGVTGVTMDTVNDSDSTDGTAALINFNASNAALSGVTINHSGAGAGSGTTEAAIRMTAGTLQNASVNNCAAYCNNLVVDGSGNPVAGAVVQNSNGYDFVVNTSDADRLRSDLFYDSDGPATRFTSAGGRFSGLASDPVQGVLFGDGQRYGVTAQVKQSINQTLDIGFAGALPPTNVSASATTGGTLASGTYYYAVFAATSGGGSCSTTANPSAPSLPSSAVTIGGANNAASITWTPTSSPLTPVVGYCVLRLTTPYFSSGTPAHFVTGGSASNDTDLGSNFTQGPNPNPPVNQMQSVHRFTQTSLGVNTTNPQFNLDVNGSAAVNSLNGVQKAERFSGADSAAQINACLTAASTAGGICDARGLTGTLTASSHIQIPAGTTLFWGRAQLTINDTTNNDAVELMGDGSSLIGYQETGLGTISRPDTSGYIACGISGCTTVDNPNAATRNVDWVHIAGMSLQATGASSKVINLTSVGHSRIQDNQLTVGTGGSSYGIYGDTSTGGQDSTNDILQHNQINLQSANDVCVRLAGIFNINVLEINVCYFASSNTGQEGFIYAKDSSSNYPNNSLVYGNDAEQGGASVSFGVIGYDIQGATDVTISNNRCEHIYACLKLPADGSALGIHLIDNYFSISNQIQILPNEPATAETAMENNGHNWAPSYHFGMNDLAGRNLLGNAGFEGWSNSTTLYYWGGVNGTNINQVGSGIYAQNTSAGTPADGTTQGTFNVKIGDNATAGLGVNSGCIQVDATMNYTLAFRIASTSASVKFRPGFRFYSDPNCTEANKITNIATNARVLAPADYAGQSASLSATGPNWKSTNASLTYNNGITCNCNVTGADWNVGTASTWTPTRNFAVTFRVPNAFSLSTTVAQSMRVFIFENTAANPNQIYVDDVVLSEGPVSPNVPLAAPLADSGNPTVYDNLTVKGSVTAGPSALPTALTSGTPAANDCAAFTSGTTTNIQDSGSACPAQLAKFSMGIALSGQAPGAANQVDVSVIYLPNIQFSKLTVDVSTTDASTSDFYSWAITDLSGNVKCSVTAVNVTASGASDQSCTQGTVTLPNGAYIFAFTGNATVGKIAYSGTAPLPLSSAVSSSTSSSGAMTFPISVPAAGVTYSSYGTPAIILH